MARDKRCSSTHETDGVPEGVEPTESDGVGDSELVGVELAVSVPDAVALGVSASDAEMLEVGLISGVWDPVSEAVLDGVVLAVPLLLAVAEPEDVAVALLEAVAEALAPTDWVAVSLSVADEDAVSDVVPCSSRAFATTSRSAASAIPQNTAQPSSADSRSCNPKRAGRLEPAAIAGESSAGGRLNSLGYFRVGSVNIRLLPMASGLCVYCTKGLPQLPKKVTKLQEREGAQGGHRTVPICPGLVTPALGRRRARQ